MPAQPTARVPFRSVVARISTLVVVVAVVATGCASGHTDARALPSTGRPSTGATGATPTSGTTATIPRPPARSRGCSVPGPVPVKGQMTEVSLTSSGLVRTSKRWVPSSYSNNQAMPLVIDLHGFIEGPDLHAKLTRLDEQAQRHGFVDLTPKGTGALVYWNAGPTPNGPRDIAFVADLITATGNELCIDLRRVYVDGFSNGAMMASLVACRLADRVAAIATVSGLMSPRNCHPARAIPILAIHGTADPLIAYDQGKPGPGPASAALPFDVVTKPNFDAVNFLPIPQAAREWAHRDHCPTPPSVVTISGTVTLTTYKACRDGVTIALYTIRGGGHTWPTGSAAGGPATTSLNTSEVLAKFFAQYHL